MVLTSKYRIKMESHDRRGGGGSFNFSVQEKHSGRGVGI